MKVYKVMKRREGRLFSAVVEGRAKVEYKEGTWISPPDWLKNRGYFLTAFESLDSALRFFLIEKTTQKSLEIWEAEVREWKRVRLPMLDIFWLETGKISYFKDYKGWPNGTIMAKELKILKKIDLEYYGAKYLLKSGSLL